MKEDDRRDIAILIVDRLVEAGYVKDCSDTDDQTEFEVQDLVEEVLTKVLPTSTETHS